ncbi:hypothetical protein OSTOST_07427, partial [Ostertagia ostertagi]
LFGCAPIFVEEVSLRCDVSSSVWLCAHFVEGFDFCLAVRPFLLKRFPFVASFRVLFGCAPILVEEVSLRCVVS